MPQSPSRLAFTGPFNANHHARALDALCERLDAGARDVLYIVASGAARRRAIADLVARRGAVFGLTVKTMSSLPRELFRRSGGGEPTPVDPIVADVLIERELRIATGNRFAGATPVQGLTAKAASTIDLLERNGATPEQLAAAIDARTVSEGARALSRTFHGTSVRRARLGSSDAEILAAAVERLRDDESVLRGLDAIVIEDLPLRTDVERKLIAAIVARAQCDVTLAHGYVRQSSGAVSFRALGWLHSTASWAETSCEPSTGVVDALFTQEAEAQPSSPSTSLLEAAGDVGEVRLAARVVRRHLNAGVRPNEIAIVVHGAATRYRDLIRELFAPAGIPVDAISRRTVADTGIGSVLLELLELAISPDALTRESSLSVARSAHLDLRTGARDRLQRNVITKGYLGLDGWDELALKTLGAGATNRINRLKRVLAEAQKGFEGVSSAADAARVVRRLARELRLVHNSFAARAGGASVVIPSEARPQGTRSRGIETLPTEGPLYRDALDSSTAPLRGSARNDTTPRPRRVARNDTATRRSTRDDRVDLAIREDNVAWEAIESALDKTVPAMLAVDRAATGKTGLAFATAWLTMFDRALRETNVGAERAPANAVQIRSTGPGCEAPARVTIVLGLIEKIFPRQARQDPFLDDDLRLVLREQYGWELPISTDTVDRERECFLRAISSATERLYLSYPATDADGRPSVRSFFIDDYEALVGPLPIERANTPTAIAQLGDTASRAELLTSISHDVWQYLPRTADSAARRAAAFRALDALNREKALVAPLAHGRRVNQRPQLDGVLPESAPHLTLTLSASQLKSIGHCTYEHFVEKVLSPIEFVPPEYNSLSKGSLIHDAAMHWSTELDGWKRGEVALPELRAWAEEQIAKWEPSKRATERTARATEADLDRLDELLRTELSLLRASDVAQPELAELAFGEKMIERGPRSAHSSVESFKLEVDTDRGSQTVAFHGSLDRVDVVTIGGTRYGVVLDYKTGRTSKYYAKDMLDGVDLQLRLYLLVLERVWGITPVGALYLGFGDGVRRGALRADMRARFAGVEEGPVKLFAHNEWEKFVSETPGLIARLVNRLVTLDVRPEPRKNDCGFCKLQPLCRYDRWSSFRAERAPSGEVVSFRAERPRSERGVEES